MTNMIKNENQFQFCTESDSSDSCIDKFKTAAPGDWFLVYLNNQDEAYEFFKDNAIKNNYLDLFLEEDRTEMLELKQITKPSWYGWYVDMIYPLDKLILLQLDSVLSMRLVEETNLEDVFENDFRDLIKLYNFYKNKESSKWYKHEDLDSRSKGFMNDLKTISEILRRTLP